MALNPAVPQSLSPVQPSKLFDGLLAATATQVGDARKIEDAAARTQALADTAEEFEIATAS